MSQKGRFWSFPHSTRLPDDVIKCKLWKKTKHRRVANINPSQHLECVKKRSEVSHQNIQLLVENALSQI